MVRRSRGTTKIRASAPARSTLVGPGLLVGGAGILLYRTIALLVGGARTVLKGWVVGLTVIELVVDVVTIAGALRWWRSRAARHAPFALRAATVATLLHAVRVLVFVLGRTGPWVDLDVRPEQRADHRERWTWREVVFAGVMSCCGVIGVVIVWQARRRACPGRERLLAVE